MKIRYKLCTKSFFFDAVSYGWPEKLFKSKMRGIIILLFCIISLCRSFIVRLEYGFLEMNRNKI